MIPAKLVKPQLPTINLPGIPKDMLGKVVVTVTEEGRVQEVRLVATTAERRYYDGMILSAIKAWIFQPAMRAGHPVRYRMVISLT